MTPDITELTIEERQNALWGLSQVQLKDLLNRMMLDCRQTEIQARLDTLTVLILQTTAPAEDIAPDDAEDADRYCGPI